MNRALHLPASGRARHLTAAAASIAAVAAVTVAIYAIKPLVPVLSLGVLYVFAVLPIAAVRGSRTRSPSPWRACSRSTGSSWSRATRSRSRTTENWFALAGRSRHRDRRERPGRPRAKARGRGGAARAGGDAPRRGLDAPTRGSACSRSSRRSRARTAEILGVDWTEDRARDHEAAARGPSPARSRRRPPRMVGRLEYPRALGARRRRPSGASSPRSPRSSP